MSFSTVHAALAGLVEGSLIASCEITGSADSTIRQVTANDLTVILRAAPIRRIYVNGRTAEGYYRRFVEPQIGRSAVCLPSTSPANAAWTPDKLIPVWRQVRDSVQEAE